MSRTRLTLSELCESSGRDLGQSEWFVVGQDRIDLFADATDDHQWIHVDREAAENGPFGTTIAHGFLTLSLVPRLLENMLEITDQVRGTNYGIERVRFTDVVPSGSRLRTTASLGEVEVRSDGGVRYAVDLTVERSGSDRPVMVGRVLVLAYSS